MKILIRYSLFAVIAMVLNLASQELSLLVYSGPLALYVAILAGTGVGLVSKYFLDKLYIFNLQTQDWTDDLNRFIAYSVTGVVTTLIFWGFELSFEMIFATKQARYLGAVIGLTIGYLLKYQLDKRYVFSDKATDRVM
ncbi:MAG: GtrA family protein [Gammaproteobacteria bacterium]|nr:GtrA family protein [Gammaproteobacteria bacterium]